MSNPNRQRTAFTGLIEMMKSPVVSAAADVAAMVAVFAGTLIVASNAPDRPKTNKDMPPVVLPKPTTPPVLNDSEETRDTAGPFLA